MESSLEKLFNLLDKNFTFYGNEKHIKIATNFTYPDGEYIYIFCEKEKAEKYIYINDLGETLRWLENNIIFSKLTKEKIQQIENICHKNNVDFFCGRISMRIIFNDNLKYDILDFLQVIMLVIKNFIKDM